jgi:hypothetical protein
LNVKENYKNHGKQFISTLKIKLTFVVVVITINEIKVIKNVILVIVNIVVIMGV